MKACSISFRQWGRHEAVHQRQRGNDSVKKPRTPRRNRTTIDPDMDEARCIPDAAMRGRAWGAAVGPSCVE